MDRITDGHRFGYENRFIGYRTVTPEPAVLPEHFNTGALLGFTAEEARRQIAVHEAAHFVAFSLVGHTPVSLWVGQPVLMTDEGGHQGWGASGANTIETGYMRTVDYLVCLAIGERAEFRHMAEAGTDSQVRRWCTEMNNAFGGGSDREVADAVARRANGTGLVYDRRNRSEASWFLAQDDADGILSDHWDAVNDLAEALLFTGSLDRESALRVTGAL